MKVRKADQQDAPFIRGLLKDNGLPFEDISSKEIVLFVGYTSPKSIIAVAGIEVHGDFGLLRSLVTKKPFRRRGYGKALCLRVIEYAKQENVKELYLLTITAKGFFKNLGFREVDRQKAPKAIQETNEFKSLCPKSALLMSMSLNPPKLTASSQLF